MDFIWQIIFVAITGVMTGFIGGQVGSGTLIAIPALLFLGLSPVEAVTTNAIAGLLGNGVAAAKYWHHKRFDIRKLLPAILLASSGAIVGAYLLIFISPEVLKSVFSILFLFVAFVVFKKPQVILHKKSMSPAMVIFGLIIVFLLGIYGGLLGIGITTLFIFYFTQFHQTSILEAVSYSMLIVTLMFVVIIIVYANYSNMNYPLAISLGLGTALGSYIGAHVAIRNGDKWLKKLLVAMAILTSIKLLTGF